MKNIFTFVSVIFFQFTFAQMAIGTTSPSPSSALEIQSANKGLLIPRVTLASTTDVETIASPATSLLVYNLNTANDITPGFYYWEGSWKTLKGNSASSALTASNSGGWGLSGNALATGSEFLGTSNYNSLLFKVNGNQFAKFHPLGGLAIGNLSTANDNFSIAIGTSANAFDNNEAIAIGKLSTASAFQSTAIGVSSKASLNFAIAIGLNSNASGETSTSIGVNSAASGQYSTSIGTNSNTSGQYATALGVSSNSSGQFATAIGYQATATQANSIILGKSGEAANKVGIGTATPDERLHVVGSVKVVDGTEGAGKLFTSDVNGKARWVNPSDNRAYADIYYTGSTQTLNQYSSVIFGSVSTSSNITTSDNNIHITKAGKYRVTYRISLSKSTNESVSATYNLYNGYSNVIPGSLATGKVDLNNPVTISGSVLVNLAVDSEIQVRSNQTNAQVSLVASGCSLSVELID